MGLTAMLLDRRCFWLLIGPAVSYWMVPWQATKLPVTPFQDRFLMLSVASTVTLLLWLALREKFVFHQKLIEETANWWLDQLQNVVMVVFGMVVWELMGKLHERLPWASYALQVAIALAFGYWTWWMAYTQNWKTVENKTGSIREKN
jgi:hypothetical protein